MPSKAVKKEKEPAAATTSSPPAEPETIAEGTEKAENAEKDAEKDAPKDASAAVNGTDATEENATPAAAPAPAQPVQAAA